MTDEQRQEIMRRQAEGMSAMSQEAMEARARQQWVGMQNAALSRTPSQEDAMRNFWGGTADERNAFIPDPPPPTLLARFKRWIRA